MIPPEGHIGTLLYPCHHCQDQRSDPIESCGGVSMGSLIVLKEF